MKNLYLCFRHIDLKLTDYDRQTLQIEMKIFNTIGSYNSHGKTRRVKNIK